MSPQFEDARGNANDLDAIARYKARTLKPASYNPDFGLHASLKEIAIGFDLQASDGWLRGDTFSSVKRVHSKPPLVDLALMPAPSTDHCT
jgi:hypothetical protein